MPRLTFLVLLFGALASISTVQSANEISQPTSEFSFDLMKEVSNEQDGNLIMSPVSVSTLLAILQQGAAGNTETQLIKVLHMRPEDSEKGYSKLIGDYKSLQDNATLEFANALFLNQNETLRNSFKNVVENKFKSQTYYVDFKDAKKAADTVNSWASQNTHGLINQLVTEDQIKAAVFVLTNAIYFKSSWRTRFNKDATQQLPFYIQGGGQVEVPTMSVKEKLIQGSIPELDSTWVEVPYQGSQFSLLIVMPNDVDGIKNLQNQFTEQHFSSILQQIKSSIAQEVIFYLPKFEITTSLNDLVTSLQKLGLIDIFTDFSNLPGITGDALKVDKVIQKAKIKVDEEGSEAAAVTGVIGVDITAVHFTPEIKVDHSCLFFITDKDNGIPLFVGRLVDPTK